jgi:hypothetical protein
MADGSFENFTLSRRRLAGMAMGVSIIILSSKIDVTPT